jgi:hypothetical protein
MNEEDARKRTCPFMPPSPITTQALPAMGMCQGAACMMWDIVYESHTYTRVASKWVSPGPQWQAIGEPRLMTISPMDPEWSEDYRIPIYKKFLGISYIARYERGPLPKVLMQEWRIREYDCRLKYPKGKKK